MPRGNGIHLKYKYRMVFNVGMVVALYIGEKVMLVRIRGKLNNCKMYCLM